MSHCEMGVSHCGQSVHPLRPLVKKCEDEWVEEIAQEEEGREVLYAEGVPWNYKIHSQRSIVA